MPRSFLNFCRHLMGKHNKADVRSSPGGMLAASFSSVGDLEKDPIQFTYFHNDSSSLQRPSSSILRPRIGGSDCDNKRTSNISDNKSEKLVCSFEESPFHILKVAEQGNVEEFVRLVNEDRNRLLVRDYREQNVVHHAVIWSRTAILDFLYQPYVINGTVDINATDKLGNTPIFLAIEKNQLKALSWLLFHGANVKLYNHQRQAPIHYAIELDNYDAVQMILKHNPQTVHMPGDLGNTPLHAACSKDLADIARLLLGHGASLIKNNDVGYPPIHAATANGSTNVIDVLLQYASKFGITEKELIHMVDKERNLPLHLSVNSGDIRGVRVCLKAGADIDRLNDSDRQTAVHYAASQGALEIIREMFHAQPDKVEACLHCRDILEQTPLHKAAMFNHVDVVELLINEGATINAQDGERRTPLLLAAAKNASKVIKVLLKRRANICLRDKENRNFLHLMIINKSNLAEIEFASLKTLNQLLNERDDFGMCPLHYASEAGQLATLQHLLQLGAVVTLTDNDKQSPLHFAAKAGRLQTCKKLLSSEQGLLLMNEVDSEGRTAVHVAAMHGYPKIIASLVRNGAHLNKDFHQNTPLHLAAENGHHEAVVLLVGLAPHHLNAKNASNNTPLHLAACNGHAIVVDYLMSMEAKFDTPNDEGATFFDVAVAKFQTEVATTVIQHRRCEEVMQLPSIFGTPVIGLVQYLPKACVQLLDRCVTYPAESNKKSRDFFIKYDFRYLQQKNDLSPGFRRRLGSNFRPLLPMETMVKYNRLELLSHPLSVTFLRHNWSVYGQRFYNIELAFYLIFLALLTLVSMELDDQVWRLYDQANKGDFLVCDSINAYHNNSNNNSISSNSSCVADVDLLKLDTSSCRIELGFLIFFCALNSFFGIVRGSQQGMAFFFDLANITEASLYILTMVGFAPHLGDYPEFNHASQCIGAAALFLGWMNLMLYFRRTSVFGIYVVMLVEVGKNLIRTLTIFSFIIIAFAIEFYIVFKTTTGRIAEFKDPFVSVMTTLTMMASESNYIHFVTPSLDGSRKLIIGHMAYFVFVAFIILLPTLLMNLLVGLAVGDIQATQKTAGLKRLAMQVQFFSDLIRRMPESLVRRYHITEYKHYPNRLRDQCFEAFWSLSSGLDDVGQSNAEFLNEVDNSGAGTEFGSVVEQLTCQSRKLYAIMHKIDAQQTMLKSIWQRLVEDGDFGGSGGDKKAVDEDDDDDAVGRCWLKTNNMSKSVASISNGNSTGELVPFRSRSHWQAITTTLRKQTLAARLSLPMDSPVRTPGSAENTRPTSPQNNLTVDNLSVTRLRSPSVTSTKQNSISE